MKSRVKYFMIEEKLCLSMPYVQAKPGYGAMAGSSIQESCFFTIKQVTDAWGLPCCDR